MKVFTKQFKKEMKNWIIYFLAIFLIFYPIFAFFYLIEDVYYLRLSNSDLFEIIVVLIVWYYISMFFVWWRMK